MNATVCRGAATIAVLLAAAACADPPSAPSARPVLVIRPNQIVLGGQLANVTVMDLGTLPGFFHHTAWAVNENGWVVGTARAQATNTTAAFLWKPGTGMASLPAPAGLVNPRALAINAAGDVAGYAVDPTSGASHATLWRAGNPPIDLGTLNPSSTQALASQALGINDAGVVVGTSEVGNIASPFPLRLAFRWTQTSGMVALPMPPNPRDAQAFAINNAGDIVGYAQTVGGEPRAVLWSGSSFTDLGVLPGGNTSSAAAVNASGVVVGGSASAVGSHGFLWTATQGMSDLGALGGTFPQGPTSEARGINDAADVVGSGQNVLGANPGYFWRNGTLYTLPPLTSSPTEFATARDINNAGKIVGSVESLNTAQRAVMWTLPSNRSPVANPGGPYAGRKKKEAIMFDGRGSSDPDGDPLTFVWDFGDGSPTATGATASHVYEKLGTYTASLMVNDGRGGVTAASVLVEILPPGKLDR